MPALKGNHKLTACRVMIASTAVSHIAVPKCIVKTGLKIILNYVYILFFINGDFDSSFC